jgi:hypothetical protein
MARRALLAGVSAFSGGGQGCTRDAGSIWSRVNPEQTSSKSADLMPKLPLTPSDTALTL